MPKYYVMLVDGPSQQLRVPVKAMQNPYDNQQPAFCADMPQFFGGSDDDDTPPPQVLAAELTQESRRTLELTSGSPTHFFSEGKMFFYWASEGQWGQTGTPWGPGANPAEREMDRIVVVDLTQFATGMTDQQIVDELVNQVAGGHSQQGRNEFGASATRAAFVNLIRAYLAGQL